jgi:hypothetical protein
MQFHVETLWRWIKRPGMHLLDSNSVLKHLQIIAVPLTSPAVPAGLVSSRLTFVRFRWQQAAHGVKYGTTTRPNKSHAHTSGRAKGDENNRMR